MKPRKSARKQAAAPKRFRSLSGDIGKLVEEARRQSARAINAILTATYWEIGRRIVEFEQRGARRSGYGRGLLENLSHDLTPRFGRGFGVDNLELMRLFYIEYPPQFVNERLHLNSETLSRNLPLPGNDAEISETVSRKFNAHDLGDVFTLPWSHYVMLLRRVKLGEARAFYETEAMRGGWSVRQLDRQISTRFYERTALSRKKAAVLRKGQIARPGELLTPEDEIKDPLVLEFLDLKDEYSESDLEEALINKLESFLLELGGNFAFIGRQRRLRIGGEWYRVDLLFFHRVLRCVVVVDLKLGKFTHADAGQMQMYLNYARERWTQPGENPPVGLILCAERDHAIAHYSLEGLSNKILAAEYRLVLPTEKHLAQETRKLLAQVTK